MAWFKKEPLVSAGESKLRLPEGLWVKCDGCKETITKPELERNLQVCPRCGYHYTSGRGPASSCWWIRAASSNTTPTSVRSTP
jgi:uncharacterized paraquat-inducible protein A